MLQYMCVYIYPPKLKGTDESTEMFVESIQTNIGWLATKQELARKIYASLQSTKLNQGPGRGADVATKKTVFGELANGR